jgi:hypothetical protein
MNCRVGCEHTEHAIMGTWTVEWAVNKSTCHTRGTHLEVCMDAWMTGPVVGSARTKCLMVKGRSCGIVWRDGLEVLNGNCVGHLKGEYAFKNQLRKSVSDYALVSQGALQTPIKFKIRAAVISSLSFACVANVKSKEQGRTSAAKWVAGPKPKDNQV